MWTHAAALGLGIFESEGACEAAGVAADLGDLPEPLAFDELQPAMSAAPLQVSATIARQARPAGRFGPPDLVIVS